MLLPLRPSPYFFFYISRQQSYNLHRVFNNNITQQDQEAAFASSLAVVHWRSREDYEHTFAEGSSLPWVANPVNCNGTLSNGTEYHSVGLKNCTQQNLLAAQSCSDTFIAVLHTILKDQLVGHTARGPSFCPKLAFSKLYSSSPKLYKTAGWKNASWR